MSNKGLKRNTLDKFYTKPEIADRCVKLFQKYIFNNDVITDDNIVIEPSAGNGSFISFIKKICKNAYFYDIVPEHNLIQQQDFLELDFKMFETKKIHIIGNPPFGRQSSTAIKFIKKACTLADSVSFILPKSFKKDSLKKHIPLVYELVHEYDIEDNSFLINNENHNVPCVYQIWRRLNIGFRTVVDKFEPINYKFVKKDENPDFSLRRVGFYAGKVCIDFTDKSIQSHYFIKILIPIDLLKLEECLNTCLVFEKDNTVGPKSISKQEVIVALNCYMV